MGTAESADGEAVLDWFEGLGYTAAHGPDIAVDGSKPAWSSYADVVLGTALSDVSPPTPPAAVEAAISKSLRLRLGSARPTSVRISAVPLHAACARTYDVLRRGEWPLRPTRPKRRGNGSAAEF